MVYRKQVIEQKQIEQPQESQEPLGVFGFARITKSGKGIKINPVKEEGIDRPVLVISLANLKGMLDGKKDFCVVSEL